MCAARRGFTLLEVLVALTVGGLVVVQAHQVFAAVADNARRLAEARAALDREANARRWLQAAFLSLDVGPEVGGGPFAGRADRVEFGTWLLVADGWLEPRRVELGREGSRFVGSIGRGEKGEGRDGEEIVFSDSVAELWFDYLLEPGERSHWVPEWISPVSAPLAVRIRVGRAGCEKRDAGCVDTMLFLIKARG